MPINSLLSRIEFGASRHWCTSRQHNRFSYGELRSQIDTLIPAHGVYAARTTIDNQQYAVALNIGPNPTFAENQAKVEAHLIGWNGDLYYKTLELEILMKLRDVQKFANVNELIATIESRCAKSLRVCNAWLDETSPHSDNKM